jgi:hypothetical protein
MTEPAADPIPDYLAQAFAEAVEAFLLDWTPSNPHQPLVNVRSAMRPIIEVCNLVDQFQDRLPDQTLGLLRQGMHVQHARMIEILSEDPTYAFGARCLRELLQERVRAYQKMEQRRS